MEVWSPLYLMYSVVDFVLWQWRRVKTIAQKETWELTQLEQNSFVAWDESLNFPNAHFSLHKRSKQRLLVHFQLRCL